MSERNIKELIDIIEYCIKKDSTSDLHEALEILHESLDECEDFDDND